MSAQRLRRWSNIGQMLYKCFVFLGYAINRDQVGLLMTATCTQMSRDNATIAIIPCVILSPWQPINVSPDSYGKHSMYYLVYMTTTSCTMLSV